MTDLSTALRSLDDGHILLSFLLELVGTFSPLAILLAVIDSLTLLSSNAQQSRPGLGHVRLD